MFSLWLWLVLDGANSEISLPKKPVWEGYRRGALLANVNTLHLGVGVLGIILSIVAVLGIYFKPRKSICRLGWDVATMFAIYLIGSWMLFIRG